MAASSTTADMKRAVIAPPAGNCSQRGMAPVAKLSRMRSVMIAQRVKPLAGVSETRALRAACAGGAPEPVTARFTPEGHIIVVTVSDPQPARAVDLVSPTGAVTKAANVTTDEASLPSSVGNPPTGIAF